MSDQDAIIGRLYRAVLDAEEVKASLLQIIAGLKSGAITTDRITLVPGGISLAPLVGVADED